jgi:DNA-binding XRE family transcriptional regulator
MANIENHKEEALPLLELKPLRELLGVTQSELAITMEVEQTS